MNHNLPTVEPTLRNEALDEAEPSYRDIFNATPGLALTFVLTPKWNHESNPLAHR